MATQAVEITVLEETRPASEGQGVYVWTCLFFAVLTMVAIYVMFHFALGEI